VRGDDSPGENDKVGHHREHVDITGVADDRAGFATAVSSEGNVQRREIGAGTHAATTVSFRVDFTVMCSHERANTARSLTPTVLPCPGLAHLPLFEKLDIVLSGTCAF